MDQKTIDKVLRCRAIIDRHRDWLREKFDKLEADVAAETAKLESKDKGDERKIAAIDGAITALQNERTASLADFDARERALQTEKTNLREQLRALRPVSLTPTEG